jgi:hypothetical protein
MIGCKSIIMLHLQVQVVFVMMGDISNHNALIKGHLDIAFSCSTVQLLSVCVQIADFRGWVAL